MITVFHILLLTQEYHLSKSPQCKGNQCIFIHQQTIPARRWNYRHILVVLEGAVSEAFGGFTRDLAVVFFLYINQSIRPILFANFSSYKRFISFCITALYFSWTCAEHVIPSQCSLDDPRGTNQLSLGPSSSTSISPSSGTRKQFTGNGTVHSSFLMGLHVLSLLVPLLVSVITHIFGLAHTRLSLSLNLRNPLKFYSSLLHSLFWS